MFYIYILESEIDQSFYIGSTDNIEERLLEHNSSQKGYTQRKRPWKVVYTEEFENKLDALKRERYLKKLKSKKYIKKLIVRARSSMVEQ